jgi:RNA polymerase-binding transcription factor DksA
MTNNTEKNDQYYLDLLKASIAKLTEEKASDEARLKEIQDDKPMSGDDVGSQRDDRERVEQEIANTEDLIIEANRAITWATKNGFICAVCSKPIEKDRLDADPASLTCKEHRDEEDTIEL